MRLQDTNIKTAYLVNIDGSDVISPQHNEIETRHDIETFSIWVNGRPQERLIELQEQMINVSDAVFILKCGRTEKIGDLALAAMEYAAKQGKEVRSYA